MPLLQTEPPMPRMRPTDDVDALLVSGGYTDAHDIETALERRGFRRSIDQGHANCWIAPGGHIFDLVPLGQHLGATTSELERIAAETADAVELEAGISIRHVNAAAFCALKLAAHEDRFRHDPLGSRDLQDVIALVASRCALPAEIARADVVIRRFVQQRIRLLLADPDAAEIIASHLNDAVPLRAVLDLTRERLEQIGS